MRLKIPDPVPVTPVTVPGRTSKPAVVRVAVPVELDDHPEPVGVIEVRAALAQAAPDEIRPLSPVHLKQFVPGRTILTDEVGLPGDEVSMQEQELAQEMHR